MFIRTRDNVNITSFNLEFFNFLSCSRKGNIANKFEVVDDNTIDFFPGELICKMIPKEKNDLLFGKDIKLLVTVDGNQLIYQDFQESPVRFLSQNEKTDEIEILSFEELNPEIEIFCFDNKLEDYYFSKISFTAIIPFVPAEEGDLEENARYMEELESLSRYIIGTDDNQGIIIGNIMII